MGNSPQIDYHDTTRVFYELNFLEEDEELLDTVRTCIEAQKAAGLDALKSTFQPHPNAREVSEAALADVLRSGAQVSGIATEPEISNCIAFNYHSVQGAVMNEQLSTHRRAVDALVSERVRALFRQARQLSVKNSGHFWYPPGGFMGWHTNPRTPGWRLYINYCEEPGKSFFRYRDQEQGTTVTAMDKVWNFRLFKITNGKPLWHAIYSDTNRFSLGYRVTLKPSLIERVKKRLVRFTAQQK